MCKANLLSPNEALTPGDVAEDIQHVANGGIGVMLFRIRAPPDPILAPRESFLLREKVECCFTSTENTSAVIVMQVVS